MPKLFIDDLVEGDIHVIGPADPARRLLDLKWVRESLRQVADARNVGGLVLDVSNVARLLYEEYDQEVFGPEDFPSVGPLAESMWVEFRAPKHVRSEGTLTSWRGSRYTAFLVTVIDFQNPPQTPHLINPFTIDALKTRARWGYHIIVFQSDPSPTLVDVALIAYIDSNGVFVQDETQDHAYIRGYGPPEYLQPLMEHHGILYSLWLGLALASCHNVSLEKVRPPERKKKGRRAHRHRPRTQHRVIQIDAMRQALKTEGQAATGGLKQALHICRGHFKTYTEDAPLFGKMVGTFYWHQHARGTGPETITKTYSA